MRAEQKQGCNCKYFFTSAYIKNVSHGAKNSNLFIRQKLNSENVKSPICHETKLQVALIFVHIP